MNELSESKQPAIFAITILFASISTILVGLRLYHRALIKRFYWDDGLICMAWALAVAQASVFLKFVVLTSQGHHIWNTSTPTVEQRVEADKWNMAQQLLYNPILCLVKASILAFLLRLGDQRMFIYWSLIALWWFNMGHLVSVFFAALTQCLPIHMYWDHYYMDKIIDGKIVNPNYDCYDMATFSLVTAGLAILTDVLILLVPAAMMWNLRMSLRQKLAVSAVLSVGWIVAILSIIRFKAFYDFWYASSTSADPTYNVTITLSGIEANVAIMTACGPALKALVTRYTPHLFSSRSSTRHTTNVYYLHEYEMNSGAGTNKNNQFMTTALHQCDDDGGSQEHIVRHSSSHTDNKSTEAPWAKELATIPSSNTLRTSEADDHASGGKRTLKKQNKQ
ncbi:hypothetical protein G6011_06324 [Alternaria panax]|uniref:Rhodopsin domain-containing protein n=1 Tax=Alternaria panax TaxID=48097 RepID=A0AAD4FGZ3_9PLEO|nr:hypothetical protein G6011_06324 [Alternaria panax]